jgi:hypothetical protein
MPEDCTCNENTSKSSGEPEGATKLGPGHQQCLVRPHIHSHTQGQATCRSPASLLPVVAASGGSDPVTATLTPDILLATARATACRASQALAANGAFVA